MRMDTIKHLQDSLKLATPKKFQHLFGFLKDFDTEEIALISECLAAMTKFEKKKRIALWHAMKVFLQD